MIGYRSEGVYFETWLRALYVAAIFIGVTYMQFTFFYPIKFLYAKYYIYVITILAFATAYIVTLTDAIIVEGVKTLSGEPIIIFGSWYPLYVFIIIVPFVSGFLRHIYVIVKHKSSVLYLLLGYLLSANIAFITNLILPWFGIFILNWVGQFFTVIMVSFTTYSIIKFNVMNIKFFAINVGVILLLIVTFSQMLFADSLKNLVVSGFVFIISGITGYVLVILSKNERKSLEHTILLNTKIKKINTELKEANEQKSEFISFASHQIRTPITVMKGYADILLDSENEKTKEIAKKIIIQGNDVVSLISQYLNKSKMELGQLQYNFSTFDITLVVKEVVANFKINAEQRGLRLEYCKESEALLVNGDQGKLKEVIGNVIDNSLKYTPKGEVVVSVNENNGKALISVKDTGVGMSKETIPLLFKEFGRADAEKVNILGTGLGLYLAKTFMEAHKGRIWAESDGEGKGAQFYIELPKV